MIKCINNLIKLYKRFKCFDDKYKISLYSASISFYMIVASFSMVNLFLGIVSKYLENVDSYVLEKLIEIFKYFKYYEYFSFDRSSIISFIILLWSASKILNAYNKASDLIYNKERRRNYWYLRFSSFVMFLFLLLIFVFELGINIFVMRILGIFKINFYIFRIIEFCIEVFMIYIIILVLYIYAPPKKMKFSDVKKGALISASLLYFEIVLIVFIYSIIYKYNYLINLNKMIIIIVSTYLLAIFVCNYIILYGLIVNSKNYKFLNQYNGNNNNECEV